MEFPPVGGGEGHDLFLDEFGFESYLKKINKEYINNTIFIQITFRISFHLRNLSINLQMGEHDLFLDEFGFESYLKRKINK